MDRLQAPRELKEEFSSGLTVFEDLLEDDPDAKLEFSVSLSMIFFPFSSFLSSFSLEELECGDELQGLEAMADGIKM